MLYRSIAIAILLSVIPIDIIPQATNKTTLQRIKESSLEKLKRAKQTFDNFIADVNDPRNNFTLFIQLEDETDPKEIEKIHRILNRRQLTQVGVTLIMLPLVWYLTRLGRQIVPSIGHRLTGSGLPIIELKLSASNLKKLLPHLHHNKKGTYNAFAILNIPQNTSTQDINDAFKKLRPRVHSDKSMQQAQKERKNLEDLGIRVIGPEEFKAKLEKIRDPNLPPVQPLPSPAVVVTPELQAAYDTTFKALTEARDKAIEYIKEQARRQSVR